MKKILLLSSILSIGFCTMTNAHYLDKEFPLTDPKKVELGKFLMFDKILSGNKNISCATCHHPLAGLGDGLSLPIGEGGNGLGITRNTGIGTHAVVERVPRNAPPVFNLAAKEFSALFYDGRVAVDSTKASGFMTPAGTQLPSGLENVLAAQAMFPVTSATEMAGQAGENSIADAATKDQLEGENGVWDLIAKRLQAIPEYVELFKQAFDDINIANDITYVHAANAIAAFESSAWRCTDSTYDRYFNKIENNQDPSNIASANVIKGAKLFYGKADCASCHSGHFMSNQKFYAIGVPQIGPGKGDDTDNRGDYGLEQVTGLTADRYKFRTLPLRQVAQTGPWGHDGAFNTLEAMVKHHLNALDSLKNYDPKQAVLPNRDDLNALDFIVQNDSNRVQAIADAISPDLKQINLTTEEIARLLDFLNALTDNNCIDLRSTVPSHIPSGLPLFD